MRQLNSCLLAGSLMLAMTSTIMGQGGSYSAIDFPGSASTLAWSINNSGDIVGLYVIAGVTHGFKLSAGQFSTFDYPGATLTDARGINNRGDISGLYRNADGVFHGFRRSGDQYTAIDFPDATSTIGWGINSSGDVVGTYTSRDGVPHGFKVSGGQYVTIDYPGSTNTTVTGINTQGDVSGVYNGSGGLVHGFVWSDGEFTSVDVPNAFYTNTTGLTARGDIIGRYQYVAGAAGYGYLLRDGNFNTIAFPGATFTGSASVNARGVIVGRYQNADGVFHGFLLSGFQPGCVSSAPQIATAAGGPAVTHASDFTLVSAAKPAAPGEVLAVFVTGLGATRPAVDPGNPFPSGPPAVVTSPIEVRVNGKPAEVLGAVGLAGTVGGYQVNFRLPPDTMKGIAALQLSSGMAVDTSVKIAVQ